MTTPVPMSGSSKRDPSARMKGGLATFFPGYFALVMATGVVSLADHQQGYEVAAYILFWLNLCFYTALWILTLLRFIFYRPQLMGDLTHHPRSAAFLTKAAATCVLGSQFVVLTAWTRVAKGFWIFGVILWLVLSYTFFVVNTVREPKPRLKAGIKGAWLLVVVATESVSILGSLVAPDLGRTDLVLFLSLSMFLLGAMLYIFFTTLILYRWMFFRMRPEKLTPDYWIDMGAMASTALAGTYLLDVSSQSALLQGLTPFLTGFTLLFWVIGTWWIPLLSMADIWRHLFKHIPFVYNPKYWSLVYPLGMYSVATHNVARTIGLSFLNPIAMVFLYAALAVWAITFIGMANTLIWLRTKRNSVGSIGIK